jgi:hypothetical protein
MESWPFAGGILIDLVATAPASEAESKFFQYRGHLASCDAGQLRH